GGAGDRSTRQQNQPVEKLFAVAAPVMRAKIVAQAQVDDAWPVQSRGPGEDVSKGIQDVAAVGKCVPIALLVGFGSDVDDVSLRSRAQKYLLPLICVPTPGGTTRHCRTVRVVYV